MSCRPGNRQRPEPQPLHSNSLYPFFDFSSLRSFTTLVDLRDASLYSSLSSAPSLTHLHLITPRNGFSAALDAFTTLLPRLTHLNSFAVEGQLRPAPPNDVASPLPLSLFLSALPATLKTLRLPLFFSEGAEDGTLAAFLAERLRSPLREVEAFEPDSTELGKRSVLRLSKVEEEVKWSERGNDVAMGQGALSSLLSTSQTAER